MKALEQETFWGSAPQLKKEPSEKHSKARLWGLKQLAIQMLATIILHN